MSPSQQPHPEEARHRDHAAGGSCLRSRPALRGSTGSPRQACSKRHVNMTISLAFLAPSLVKAASTAARDRRRPRRWMVCPTWN
jgi:hypothetical protein